MSRTLLDSSAAFETTGCGVAVPYNFPDIPTVNTSPDNRLNVDE